MLKSDISDFPAESIAVLNITDKDFASAEATKGFPIAFGIFGAASFACIYERCYKKQGWHKTAEQYQKHYNEQENGTREVFAAEADGMQQGMLRSFRMTH